MRKLSFHEAEFRFSLEKIEKLKSLGTKSEIIGQQRALKALEMGLGLKASGFNIFVMGDSGTGRRTAINKVLADFKVNYKNVCDIAYVYNFQNPFEPDAIFFPAAKGLSFKRSLKQALNDVLDMTVSLSCSESYLTKSNRILSESNAIETRLLLDFESEMSDRGFRLVQIKQEGVPSSFDLNPIIDGKDVSFSDLQEKLEHAEISEKDFRSLKEKYYTCLEDMNGFFDKIKANQAVCKEKLKNLLYASVEPIIASCLKPLFEKVKGFELLFVKDGKENCEKLRVFLQNIEKNLIETVQVFYKGFKQSANKKKFLAKYDINVICENSSEKNYVVSENLPSFSNLFGSIDTASLTESSVRDAHMRICPGAVHRAFGGYLILRLQDLLQEEDSYFYLKRVLQSEKIEIQVSSSSNSGASVFKPKALPAKFKLIVIGEANSYDTMYETDPDFSKLFKVCAEFSSVMIRNDENELAFISFVNKIAEEHTVPTIETSAYARLLAYACELSGSRKFISTQFSKVSDLILQAALIAKRKSSKTIDEAIITQTIKDLRFLYSLPEEEYLNELKFASVFLTVSGKKIGSINGLAVQDRGYFSFGLTERITAQSSPGETGLINIESEVGFSGEVYDKAHMIISSLLKNTYARDTKLSVDASICFEQSYGIIEGDSASCAEFLALLSSISEIPFRQDLAITGSLNQHGDVQAIGGLSEKIEGFFKVCKILGFTGSQGVVIPEANCEDLFLSDEVLKAVKEGSFSIYAIRTIDEAVEIFSDCSHEEISKAVKLRLENFNRVMKKIVSVEK